MFGIDGSEFAVVALVALLVIGPKDLPRVMRTVGHWVGRARGMARHVRSGFDTMVRESEIEEMNKRWEAENKKIMAATADHFALSPSPDPAMAADGEALFPADPAALPAPAEAPVPAPAPAQP